MTSKAGSETLVRACYINGERERRDSGYGAKLVFVATTPLRTTPAQGGPCRGSLAFLLCHFSVRVTLSIVTRAGRPSIPCTSLSFQTFSLWAGGGQAPNLQKPKTKLQFGSEFNPQPAGHTTSYSRSFGSFFCFSYSSPSPTFVYPDRKSVV